MSMIWAWRKLREEDSHKFEANLSYTIKPWNIRRRWEDVVVWELSPVFEHLVPRWRDCHRDVSNFLEEVQHWEWALGVHTLALLSVCCLCFIFAVETVIIRLSTITCSQASPTIVGESPSGTINKHKYFLSWVALDLIWSQQRRKVVKAEEEGSISSDIHPRSSS